MIEILCSALKYWTLYPYANSTLSHKGTITHTTHTLTLTLTNASLHSKTKGIQILCMSTFLFNICQCCLTALWEGGAEAVSSSYLGNQGQGWWSHMRFSQWHIIISATSSGFAGRRISKCTSVQGQLKISEHWNTSMRNKLKEDIPTMNWLK